MRRCCAAVAAALSLISSSSRAAPPSCPAGQAWDGSMSMCMPEPAASNDGSDYFDFAMAMSLPKPRALGRFSGMAMANVFLAYVGEAGPRGRNALTAPNWVMFDLGVDLARWNRVELDVMLTAERWTFPDEGYPLLLQIGETNARGQPYIDAQHPHASPLMGLTLTDVISFSAARTRLVRVYFAPRGESTDGPIPMMHRPTAAVNPDAPLGHHIGQDVGHISSTVIGVSLFVGDTIVEASTFHGREPQPAQVDLPIAAPDSFAARVVGRFGRHFTAAASIAYVTDPEGEPDVPNELRLSASGYTQWELPRHWQAEGALIWGGITNFDRATFLDSITGEWLFHDDADQLWGRAEALQRTPGELAVPSGARDAAKWVGALTVGYTHRLASLWAFDFCVGGSATLSFVPNSFAAVYGGNSIFSGKLFLEVRLMRMFARGR